MKRAAIVSAAVFLTFLVCAILWLAVRQQGLQRDLVALQGENLVLAQELAQRPNLSAEELAAAARRLENAGVFIDAVESRLTNASALLQQLQNASRQLSGPGRRRSSIDASAQDLREHSALGWTTSTADSQPRQPVSSHTADGRLFQRNWGPEQVIGPPNTHAAGDMPTAWAPFASQGGPGEWLQVNYDRAVDVSEVRVRETYNPGAIAKLAAVLPNGQEVVIWEGTTPPAQAPVDTGFFSTANGVQAQSVRIYLDRTRAPGWNEIDAVELVGRDGTRQWASSATASTSFAEPSRQ